MGESAKAWSAVQDDCGHFSARASCGRLEELSTLQSRYDLDVAITNKREALDQIRPLLTA